MKSSVTDPFFQFPLSMIQQANSSGEVIRAAVSYALWNFGESMSDADVQFNYSAY